MRVIEVFLTLICALCGLGALAIAWVNAHRRQSNIEHVKQLEAENEYIDHFNQRMTERKEI